MSNIISHKGVIESISPSMIHVRIVQNSACASCKIAAHCTSAESKEKIIDVPTTNQNQYYTGQEVTVMAASSVGAKAVVIAFCIPTVLLLSVITTCIVMGTTDLVAASAGLFSLVPYYILLYLTRHRLEKSLVFYLE